jgi:hypothetical protein
MTVDSEANIRSAVVKDRSFLGDGISLTVIIRNGNIETTYFGSAPWDSQKAIDHTNALIDERDEEYPTILRRRHIAVRATPVMLRVNLLLSIRIRNLQPQFPNTFQTLVS